MSRPSASPACTLSWLSIGAAAVVGAGTASGGCFEPDDTLVNYTTVTATSGVGGGGGAGTGDITAKEYFETVVKEELVSNCAGSECHSSGSRAFLLAGQEYSVITQYETSWGACLLTDPPNQSPLITYPSTDEHTGRGWGAIPEVRSNVHTWLTLEASKPMPTGCSEEAAMLQVGPIDPEGFTQIPLSGLGAELSGFVLTFYAAELGDPPSVLELSDVSVWPPNQRGIRIVDPTFVLLPGEGEALTDTSFHGDPYVLTAPDAVQLGPGELVSTSWGEGWQLAIRFSEVRMLFADADGNTFSPCTRVNLYTEAVDALPVIDQPNQPNGLAYCAEQCHGGAEGPSPTTVMDLSELLDSPRDDAFACAKTRPFITPTQPQASSVVTVTDPVGAAAHPFTFGGSSGAHDAFVEAMTPWIDAEGMER